MIRVYFLFRTQIGLDRPTILLIPLYIVYIHTNTIATIMTLTEKYTTTLTEKNTRLEAELRASSRLEAELRASSRLEAELRASSFSFSSSSSSLFWLRRYWTTHILAPTLLDNSHPGSDVIDNYSFSAYSSKSTKKD